MQKLTLTHSQIAVSLQLNIMVQTERSLDIFQGIVHVNRWLSGVKNTLTTELAAWGRDVAEAVRFTGKILAIGCNALAWGVWG
jgi:hypothetical protein